MRAKLVKENIGNILKPKSKEDIIKSLKNLSQKEKDEKLRDASRNGDLNIAKLLIEVGANINTKDKNKNTALMYASIYGNLDIVKLLIEAGANINAKNIFEYTALMYASRYNNKNIVEYIKNKEEF